MNYLQSPAFGQSDMGASSHDVHLIMIFVGVLALAAAMQIVVMILAALTAGKVIKDAKELTERVESAVVPLMNKASSLLDELTPKVRTITENVSEITYTVRSKVDEVGVTVSEWNRTAQDANLKTRSQVNHMDRMVGSALTSTEQMAETVAHGIKVPLRQVAGVVAGVRATVDRLVENFGQKNRRGYGGDPRSGGLDGGPGSGPGGGQDMGM